MLGLKKKSSKKAQAFPIRVKTGDTVVVITGKDKGKTGIVKRVFREKGRVLVEGINIVKKATRPNPMAGIRGGIIERENPIAASNVMLYSTKENKATRIAHKTLENGKKTRVSKSGEQFDA